MYDKELRDSLFPIHCLNPECDCSYDVEGFAHIYMLWGYIYLTNGSYYVLGFTCPKCNKTTLTKQSQIPKPIYVNNLETYASAYQPNYEDGSTAKIYTSFPTRFLPEELIEKNDDLIKELSKRKFPILPYSVPTEYQNYCQSFNPLDRSVPFFYEEDFEKLLEIENNSGFKIFPRIASQISVYRNSDYWLGATADNLDLRQSDNFFEKAHDALERLYVLEFETTHKPNERYQKYYQHLISNDLSPDEFKDMDRDLYAWKTSKFMSNISELIKDYKKIRNRIDFELICYNELINKYARKFYYQKGLFKDQMALVQADYEDQIKSESSGINDRFDEEINSLKQDIDSEVAQFYPHVDDEGIDEDHFELGYDIYSTDFSNPDDEDDQPDDNDFADGEDCGDNLTNKKPIISNTIQKDSHQITENAKPGKFVSPNDAEKKPQSDSKTGVQDPDEKNDNIKTKTILKKKKDDESKSDSNNHE